MSNEVRNNQVVLKDYISTGFPKESDMVFRTSTISPKLPEGSKGVLLVKNLYLSCDPYMRSRMSLLVDSYIESFTIGSPIIGHGVAKVLDSAHPNFKTGDIIWGMTGWEEYSLITQPDQFFKIPYNDVPLSYYTGILGMPGMTAYAGFYEVGSPKKGKMFSFQLLLELLANLWGSLQNYSAAMWLGVLDPKKGTPLDIDLLKNKFGFDEAFNYKEEQTLDAALKRYFPDGIDIYFENVGGSMLDAVLANMRKKGRILVCGLISQYNRDEPEGTKNLFYLVMKGIRMEGFSVVDYYHLYPKFVEMVVPLIREGKIKYVEDVVEGLESAPSALVGLFAGRNVGKQVVVVARE